MPTGPPPPGGDQHIGYHLIVLRSFLIVPATIIIALRLYTRARITRSPGLDDFFIVLALVRGLGHGDMCRFLISRSY